MSTKEGRINISTPHKKAWIQTPLDNSLAITFLDDEPLLQRANNEGNLCKVIRNSDIKCILVFALFLYDSELFSKYFVHPDQLTLTLKSLLFEQHIFLFKKKASR